MAGYDDAALKAKFDAYCNFGVSGAKTTMTDKNLTKAFKDNKLFGKTFTNTDTDIAFSKVKEKGKKEITYAQFKELLKTVAPKYGKDHKIAKEEESVCALCNAIIQSSGPSTAGTTKTSKTGGVAKMTDTSQYTGSHKERFDASGKGKGAEGRKDVADTSGYVGAYKGSGSYDKKN